MAIMTVKQYDRLKEAAKAGDKELMEQIRGEAYGEDSTIIDVDVETDEVEFTDEEVMDDVTAGLTNAEIAEKYGISVQKIGAIKKKAK